MILQTVELSPNQKAAIEETLGRKLQDRENIVLCGNKLRVASVADRENAAQKMRYQLFSVAQILVLKLGGQLVRLLILQAKKRTHAVIW